MLASPALSGEGSNVTLLDRLWKHAEHRPDDAFGQIFSQGGVERISWSQLRNRACAYAHAFKAAGAGRGDVVLIFLPHGPELFYSYFGAMAAGAIPSFMPLPSVKQDSEIYWNSHRILFDRIRPKAVLTTAEHRASMGQTFQLDGSTTFLAVEDIDLADPAPITLNISMDDVALLQHSSGTTGLKKGVALSHRAIGAQLDAYGKSLSLNGDDVIVSWLPVYHDMGLIACTLLPVYFGLPLISMDPFQWLARPGVLFEAAETYKGTMIWLPNFAFQHLARISPPRRLKIGNLGSVRALINCSEVCRAATFETFEKTFAPIGINASHLQVCYAAAETVYAITQTRLGEPVTVLTIDAAALGDGNVVPTTPDAPNAQQLLSCGTPIEALTVEIVGEDGRILPEGKVGEVTVRGNSLFDGYYNLPTITAQKLRDGRYYSSDLGFHWDGELYVLGRKDDVIVVNGRNYMAHDLEAVANRVPGLKPGRNVALGVFNEKLGSNEICFVAEYDAEGDPADREAAPEALREALLNQADAACADVQIVEPGWLVKTTSGKISREKNLGKYVEFFS